MGNLAMKCEMQCQNRKVMISCVGKGTVDVRVVKADGPEVEEFGRAVVAAEVMNQFPDYVIVQWCPWRNTKLGKRGQLRVLQRHEVLTPQQIYILFPIPVEVLKNVSATARRSRRMQTTKDRLSLLLHRSGMGKASSSGTTAATDDDLQEHEQPPRHDEKSTDDARSEIVEETQPPSFGMFRGGVRRSKSSAETIQEEEETSVKEVGTSSRNPALYLTPFFAGSGWRPALLSIPESPKTPNTPKTPIAFRLFSTRSCPGSDRGSDKLA